MKKKFYLSAVSIAVALALAGCGGGGGSSTTTTTGGTTGGTNAEGETLSVVTTGFSLPSEISAVPASNSASAQTNSLTRSLKAFTRAASDLAATSDYKKAHTKKFVEERALEQFDIIEQVLNAVGQTNYADESNVNAGAYTAMVAWSEESDGREVKTLEPWVIDSRMIVVNGVDVNRVLAWIEEPDHDNPGQIRLVKAEFKIYSAANTNADGSYADYGEWDLNVSFDESATSYFAASSRIVGGVNTIKVHEVGLGPQDGELKGVLVRSGSTGYGKVSYPDWDYCWQNQTGPDCTPPSITAQYAYNDNYVAVDADINDNDAPVFKDRDPLNAVEMTHRYGLFYAAANADAGIAAGDNVEKHKSFGFPVAFTNDTDFRDHAYYGAWQGRHELWSGSPNGIAPGTVVARDDRGPDASAQTYVVSDKFNGTFTKRILVDGDLSDIQGIAVETFVNKHYDLSWDDSQNSGAGAWMVCEGHMEWQEVSPGNWQDTCVDFNGNPVTKQLFTKFSSLLMSDNDRKHVHIGGGWDNVNNQPIEYVYLNADPGNGVSYSGEGFYSASRDQQNKLVVSQGATKLAPNNNDRLWVDIGGSIYIQYTGDFSAGKTGWVQKVLDSFDQQQWRPVFKDSSFDTAFSPEIGREYYINSNGANFVVKRRGQDNLASDYDVKIELQSAANPVNVASFIPSQVAYFRTPWRPETRYTFVSTPGTNFLKLVYATDDPNTPENDIGEVYTSGEWGLQAYTDSGTANDLADDKPLLINSDGTVTAITVDQHGFPDLAVYTDPDNIPRPTEFNWEYSDGGWGTQQFLCTPDCSVVANYVILDNPVQLQPITAANGAGVNKTLSLQFDGWMHGLPDLYHELSKNNWQMSQEIKDKVINIPAGTEVSDGDAVAYYLKPLEISVFLDEVPSNTADLPQITTADTISLDDVPVFVAHNMGAKPADTVVKYSEGKATGN